MSVRAAAIWALASQYISFLIQFGASVVLARWFISPSELGLFSIAFAAVALIAFLQDFGVNRFVTGTPDLDDAKVQTAYTISVAVAWTVALIGLLAAKPIVAYYGDPAMLPVAQVIAASYFLVPLAIVPQAMCQRRMDFRSNTMIEVGASITNAVVAVILAMRGYGALALAWGAFAQQAARLVISQWRAGVMLPWPLRFSDIGPVMRLGGTNSLLSVCSSVSLRAPELVIGRIIDSAAVGLYSRAAGLASQLRQLLSGSVSGVFYPAFRLVRDRGEPLGPPYLRVVAAFTGITWPAMAGIAVLAEPIVRLLYGDRWVGAAPLLVWIALSQLFYVALPLYVDMPLLLGKMRSLINRNLVDTIASVALLAVAAPFGLEWVAASRVAHGVIWVALYAGMLQQLLRFDWKELIATYLRSGAATLAALLPALLFYEVWDDAAHAGFLQILASAALGALCWLGTLRLVNHPAFAEIAVLSAPLLRRLPARA